MNHGWLSWTMIVLGTIMAVAFAIASLATGMYGCGAPCTGFLGAFWLSIALIGYGIYTIIRRRRKHKLNKNT